MKTCIFTNKPIKVYFKYNRDKYVTDIQSEIYLDNTAGWHYLTSGIGDKFAHAQTAMLSKPLKDDDGNYRYTIMDMYYEMNGYTPDGVKKDKVINEQK